MYEVNAFILCDLMYKNYFILNRIILELNSTLIQPIITEIFSQEKDKLVFKCINGEEKYIEVSVNPGLPFITMKKEYHRTKKNSIDFFVEYLPANLERFEISTSDRIIKIKCPDINFYFAIRGKFTNVFAEKNNKILTSFKSEEESYLEDFEREIAGQKFTSMKNIPNFAEGSFTESDFQRVGSLFNDAEEFRKRYPILGKEIIAELKTRYPTNNKDIAGHLHQILEELFEQIPAVFLSPATNELFLSVNTFRSFPSDEIKTFDSMIDAQNFYFGRKFYLDAFFTKRKIIEKYIERELSKLSAKMNDLKVRVERGSRDEEYNKTGNLLLINLNHIPRKHEFVELEDIYENKTIKIKLDPKLTPQQNADYYFKKASNEKKAYKKSSELLDEISNNYKRFLKIKDNFLKTDSMEEIKSIMKELHIKQEEKKNPQDEMQSKFKHYIIENKYDVFVGKDSANNDLLTLKFAKQNDYWFHARSMPGSHVVLRVVNTKEPVPKNILKKAASIAAYHSKAKTSGIAPVSYTLKKYVTKKKGMEPGKVALLKEDVLLVKPEVPEGCEYVA